MANHIMYFEKIRQFLRIMINHIRFYKVGQCSTFLINHVIFSQNITEQVFLTNQKLEMNMPQIFKTKCIEISENIEAEKEFRFGGSKNGKIK